MNPFALLLGLLGAGAMSSLGSLKKDVGVKNPKSEKNDPVDQTNNDVTDPPAEEPVDEPVVEEPPVVAEDPVPETPEEPPVVVQYPTPQAPVQSGGSTSGNTTDPIVANGTVEVIAGRVTTLAAPGDDITNVRTISGTEHGTVTVNPDNTLALVMTQSEFVGAQSFTYEAIHSDGFVSTHDLGLNVISGIQAGGWGTGEHHYMLETDENDRVIVEAGDIHTKVYVSGSDSALSLADIAAIEQLSVDKITGSWLKNNGEYGQSEDMALAEDAAKALWYSVSGQYSQTSNWLLFERGYDYGEMGNMVYRDGGGEDELHPLYIGAWGEGDRPEITNYVKWVHDTSDNIVVQDLHFTGGISILNAENVIFDNIKVTDEQLNIMYSTGITVRNSEIYDNTSDAPSGSDGDWAAIADRAQGVYIGKVDGLLMENNFFDHNGWEDGYDPYGSGSDPQPPSMYSHNMYLAESNHDVTVRDTITMRASSFGLGLRSGGFIEDVVSLDNNAGISFDGGAYNGAESIGEYTLISDTVITSGAHKWSDEKIGALTMGLQDLGQMTSLVDNIVAHLADPNNPGELSDKLYAHNALKTTDPYYNDTVVWNWESKYSLSDGSPDNNLNADGLDTNVLNQTTIQLFTAQLLGKPDATIADLADYLRAQGDGAFDDIVDADLIIRFFQEGFGIAPDIRDTEATLRFIPNDLGEGVRWDNRLNWDTEDLPGTQDGDSVNLGGNHVVFGTNATIDTLDFGPDGALNVYGGKLTATGGMTSDTGGQVNIQGAGQVWTEGYDGDGVLDVNVDGGRFANTGQVSNTDLTATGGQTILATGGAEFDVTAGRTLAIFEAAAKVGFDGDDGGIAILDLHQGSKLAFSAQDGSFGSIKEFHSGAFGESPNVQSGIDLGNSTLEIDLSGLNADAGNAFTLMDSDELVGLFEAANVGGLGARDATIVVDYINDSVTLELTAGSGLVSVKTLGDESDHEAEEDSLWAALTADQGLAEDLDVPEEDLDPLLAA